MGSTKEEMKPSTKKSAKVVNAADTAGAATGGIFDKIRAKVSGKNKANKNQNFADLMQEFYDVLTEANKTASIKALSEDTQVLIPKIEVRLDHMIVTKAHELETERGEENYNRRQVARLRTMQWHWNTISESLDHADDPYQVGATAKTLLDQINYHTEAVIELIVEYNDDKDKN